ncbi:MULTISPECIES: ABC transporter substrate-binding protein [unclassified Streptomyces]|uniref:ABC transporter substrate-binding protein n=1 Tax=unclassified Streptomyces TaxID=2593676 RepID=UPI00081E4D04|nr:MULTISPECIES: ABC transporter substrate-binding protein [unclassified Streptomyces]MYZ37408.1 peptide-binding protein [Streptomyces sp. SID4917]SCF91085.1 peptide/nickel transport system substrate-binding protein [Streptomyces sp. MnatMP-M17]
MRSIRMRILITCLVLVVAGVGGWQLLPSDPAGQKPITVGTTDVVTSLDPAGAYDAGSWALFSNIYQSLLTFKPDSVTPVPDAARECAFVGTELRTYRCELRDDLRFPSGRAMTGEDVKYSFDRVLTIKSDVGPRSLFTTLKSVVAKGLTVTFNLTSRDATFPLKVATGAGSIVDRTRYPADVLRAGFEADGSGPYILTAYTPGSTVHLVPNPGYHGAIDETGGPVDIAYFETSDQLAAAWKARTVDVTHRQLPPSLIARLDAGNDGIRVNEAESAAIRNLVFNVREGSPLADTAVRRAIAATVDRAEIVTGVYDSTVDPLYSLIPQGVTSHTTPFFDSYPDPDPERAKQLLADAGVRTPVRFTLAHAQGGSAAPEAAELRKQLEATGLFKVKIVEKEWTEFQKGYSQGEYDAYCVSWLPDFPDPDNFVQPLVGRESTLHNGYASEQVDQLIESTQQYSERARASQDFRTLQKVVAADVPVLPLWQKKDYVLSTEDITGSQYLSDGTGLWRLWALGRL